MLKGRYNLDKKQNRSVNIKFLFNQFLHIYIFSTCVDKLDCIEDILFSSDKDKDKCLYKISIEKLMEIVSYIVHSDVYKRSWKRDPEAKHVFQIKQKYVFDSSVKSLGLLIAILFKKIILSQK